MRKRIFRGILLCCVVVLLFCFAYATFSLYRFYDDGIFHELSVEAELIHQGLNESGIDYLDNISIEDTRITYIAQDGRVLFDSSADPSIMENHADRQEVIDALQNGMGQSTRTSATLLQKTYYYALRTDEGSIIRVASTQHSFGTYTLRFLPILLLLTFAAGILSFVLAKRITRNIMEPINHIDLENPRAHACYDELSPLLDRIDRQNELSKNRMDDILRAQQERALQEQYRREFTSNVSHELKTPLTSIYGISDMMINGMIKHEDIGMFAQTIHDESGRLIALVQDILHLSQLDEGKVPEFKETVDLFEVCKNVVQRLDPVIQQKQIHLYLEGKTTPVEGYFFLLEDMIYNLVDNAIKYNHQGGNVWLSAEPLDEGARLIVRDNGIGIPKEHQQRVFERFYRVDKSLSRKIGGTGLGLSIVKHAAAEHSAAVRMESQVGVGTTVTITF